MACHIQIIYKIDGKEEVGGVIPTNLNSYDDVNNAAIVEAINSLDIDSINALIDKLSDLKLQASTVAYSNGEQLIGNTDLDKVSELVDSVQNEDLKSDFYILLQRLKDIGISGTNILLLNNENISLRIVGEEQDVRGALLNNNFIILNTNGTFNERTLRDLNHELLHLYFTKIPKNTENFNRINEIAYNIFKAAKINRKTNPYIDEFVSKVSNQSGTYDLSEFIAYIITEPKYQSVLGLDTSKGDFKEFLDRIFSVDVNVFNIGLNKDIDYIDMNSSGIQFVGKNDSYYIENEIPKSNNVSYQEVSKLIWDSYEQSQWNDNNRLALNYSEPVNVNSELQLYSLQPGDVLLIPNFNKSDGEIIYGNFNAEYFSHSNYYPIQSVWKNRNGETFVTLVNKYGDKGVGHFTVSYTDLVKLSLEKRKPLRFRKFYGQLKEVSIPIEDVKSIRDLYDINLESENTDTQPLVRATAFDERGREFKYYTIGNGGFALNVEGIDNSLINQELRPSDIVKLKVWQKSDESSEWDSFSFYAPVIRSIGTVVEVAIKSKDGKYFTKKVPFKDIEQVIFTKYNHGDLVNLQNLYIENYDKYKSQTKDKSLYQSVWFNLNSLYEDNQQFKRLQGDFIDNLDRQSVVDYRREKVRTLHVGDSISVEWDMRREDGSPVISKHIVIGVSGDTVFFLNHGKTGVSSVDLKTEYPSSDESLNIPSLVAIHYNNSSDLDLVQDLESKKDAINKSFTKHDGKTMFTPESNYVALADLYNIINIDSTNIDEVSKLERGDIVKFREGDISFIGVVSKYDPISGTIEVPGSYKSGKYEGRTFRKTVDISQIEYIGLALNPNYSLGIIGHYEISKYKEKRLSRLYDINHSTYDYSLENIIKKKSLLNRTTDWVTEQEAVYVVPKNITNRDFTYKYSNAKKKGIPYGRVVLLTPTIQGLIDSGDLIDLTQEYIKANNIKSDTLYGLKNIKTGIQLPDTTGFDIDYKAYKRTPEQIINILEVEDVVKIKYSDNYTKYLRVRGITDKGINLESEVIGLDGKVYNNSWYINFNDILSEKYKITELLYPSNRTRKAELDNLAVTETVPTNTNVKYFTDQFDKFDRIKILNRIISNINDNFNSAIKVIDTSGIQDLVDSGTLNSSLADSFKQSGAFIWNKDIYVNTDKASISSPIHELFHIIMGVMRSRNPSLYYSLLDKAGTLPDFNNRYREVLSNRTVSDAKEEAFVELMAESLSGVFSQEQFKLESLLTSSDFYPEFLKVLDDSLQLDLESVPNKTSEVLSKEISNLPIEKVITEFNSLLINSSNKQYSLFNESNMNAAFQNRNITNIKTGLLNSKDPNGKLIEQC